MKILKCVSLVLSLIFTISASAKKNYSDELLFSAAAEQSSRVIENFDWDWRFARFGLQADGTRVEEPSNIENIDYADASWRLEGKSERSGWILYRLENGNKVQSFNLYPSI